MKETVATAYATSGHRHSGRSTRKRSKQLPKELQEMARNLVSLRHEISETQDILGSIEIDLQKKESELSMEQEKIKRSERRLLNIKNLKEHEALSREIRLGKKVAGEIEDSMLELMNRVEQLKKNLDKKQAEYTRM